jgi:hypothetical protein
MIENDLSLKWWIALPSVSTKSRRPDERCVPELLNRPIGVYLNESRPRPSSVEVHGQTPSGSPPGSEGQ